MSVENFDGPGLSDQPSIIYGYTDGTNDLHIKELSRSGYGEPGPSPGDVIDRDATKSSLDDDLPELPLPGQDGLQYNDCGEDIPVFACSDCGSPIYAGRTCANPLCSRGWASAVKAKAIRVGGKLETMRHVLYSRYNKNVDIDLNHVVASMPDFLVDSETPIDRAVDVLQALLKHHWGIEEFVVIYHPYRIKKEYRADQYDHGGEPGEGDMTWSDVLSADNPDKYIYHSPHFHLFFPARRRQFDYSVVEAVQAQSGWSFHRITKGGPNSDSNVSVEDIEDLIHQITYCFSHAGVQQVADRHELWSRMKGDLHNLYVPDDITEQATAAFCTAAPRLLGVQFVQLSEASCPAEVSPEDNEDEEVGETVDEGVDSDNQEDDEPDHPLYDVFHTDDPISPSTTGRDGDPWASGTLDTLAGGSDGDGDDWATSTVAAETETERVEAAPSVSDGSDTTSPVTDARRTCGGELVPMGEAKQLLDDEQWCRRAAYVSALRTAVDHWERIGDTEGDYPWTDDDDPAPSAVTNPHG